MRVVLQPLQVGPKCLAGLGSVGGPVSIGTHLRVLLGIYPPKTRDSKLWPTGQTWPTKTVCKWCLIGPQLHPFGSTAELGS